MKHTAATPYHIGRKIKPGYEINDKDGILAEVYGETSIQAEQDAGFICLACNSHDELLGAAKQLVEAAKEYRILTYHQAMDLKDLVKRCEGE